MKKKLLKMSLITFIIALAVFAVAYFFFHYVTDEGITFIKQNEAGKPFVTDMIGQLGVILFASGVLSFIAAFVFGDEK